MLPFIINFLFNRSIQVRANGSLSHPVIIKNGVPQGSVMSTTLFLIGINDISINLKPPIKTQLIADDITITCSGKNISSINKQPSNTLQVKNNWLKIFSQKNILFTRKTKLNPPLKLYLSNLEIKLTDTIKILDLIFDKKLS